MTNFISENKMLTAVIVLIILMLAYHFLWMTKEKAALIVYKHISGVDWEGDFLIARANAIKNKKANFKHKGSTYDTDSGKKLA